jgi:hypothetical protein
MSVPSTMMDWSGNLTGLFLVTKAIGEATSTIIQTAKGDF